MGARSLPDLVNMAARLGLRPPSRSAQLAVDSSPAMLVSRAYQ
jgi:hypothetical protein